MRFQTIDKYIIIRLANVCFFYSRKGGGNVNDQSNLTNEKWIVYVDETYLEPDHRIITAFWAINKSKEEKVFAKYRNIVYSVERKLEAKSTRISDAFHVQALKSIKGYRSKCVISDFNLAEFTKTEEPNKFLKTAIGIYAYLMPIQAILKQIKQVTKAQNIHVQIIIDNLTNFQPGSQFALYSRYFLNRIENEMNSNKLNFKLEWTMDDSEERLGIQIADLICGAYRKEIMYRKFQPDIELIPFKYLKFNSDKSLFQNKDFLQIYALLQLIPEPKPVKKEIKTVPEKDEKPKLHLLYDFKDLKILIKEIDRFLIDNLNNPIENLVLICDVLHQYFNQIFQDTKRYLALRQKYTKKKDCLLIINNFRKNLIVLEQVANAGQLGSGNVEKYYLEECLSALRKIEINQ